MKDLSDLKHRIQVKTLDLVTQRNGASVYQGQSSQGEVFIKIANIQTANDRYCEILEALKEFPLTPNVLNKFEWEGSSILVMSAIEGRQVDQVLKNCTRVENLFAWECRTSFGRTSSCASTNAHIEYEVLARS